MSSATRLVKVAGLVAILWAYVGLVVGLVPSIRIARLKLDVRRHRQGWLALHRQLNLVALALVVLHLVAFVVAPGGSLLVALVPQTAVVGRLGYTLGVLAFYLAVLVGPTWYVRDRIGRWGWLLLHQAAALSYAAGLLHTLLLGGDVRVAGPIRLAIGVAQAPLLVLLVLRITHPRRPADLLTAGDEARFSGPRHTAFRTAVHASVVVTAFVVLGVALTALGAAEHSTR